MNNIFRKSITLLKHRIPLLAILCLLVVYTWANTLFVSQSASPSVPTPNNTKKIELRKAEQMVRNNTPVIELHDNVELYHDGATMYCDLAYLDDQNNRFEAIGNVRIIQGDSIELKGDYLHYDAIYRLAKMRNNVVLEDKKAMATLFTDSLNFDRMVNIAYYFDGGMVVDTINELTSIWGQYEPNLKLATFRDSVRLFNPKYTIHSDTLQYSTLSGIATILGPAVVESDSGTIYTSKGWYNTHTEESMLLNQSVVVNKPKTQFLTGDTIYYNRLKSVADVYGNMALRDTLKKIILKGHRGHYDGSLNQAWATNKAQALEYSRGDTLYLHADTLKFIHGDSARHTLKAYRNTRFFRIDLQGVGDSLQYNASDSTLHIYNNASLWSAEYQLTGDSIHIQIKDSVRRKISLEHNSYIIQQIDTLKYNQLAGRKIDAFVQGQELNHVYVDGNARSIFFPQEKDSSYIGLNLTESSYLAIDLENKKVKKLKLWGEPKASITPIPLITPEQFKLKGVMWLDKLRPKDPEDIFRATPTDSLATPKRVSRFTNTEE